MKKINVIGLLLTVLTSMSHATPESFGSIDLGFEMISYDEKIFIFGEELGQELEVINFIQHTMSYTAFDNKKYGFYLESSSTLFEEIETEIWNMSGYGHLQKNQLTMSTVDVKLLGAYSVGNHSQLLAGISFFSLNFTRSDLSREAGGDLLHSAIVSGALDSYLTEDQINEADCEADGIGDFDGLGEKGFCPSISTITENKNSVEFILGYLYDMNLGAPRELSWYAQADLTLPIWQRTINTAFGGTTLSRFGGGWGANARTGFRWSIAEKIKINVGVMANYKWKSQISVDADFRTLSVPEINYLNIQVVGGLVWYL